LSETTIPFERKIDPVGVLSEILANITDERQIIRELLSNSVAPSVKAKNIFIRVYESNKGLALTVKDDGVGMSFGAESKGRLDRFLNIGQGKRSGAESDEFGEKGFGTKILYNAAEVEVVTWDGGPTAYKIVLLEPRKTLFVDKKDVPVNPRPFSPLPGMEKGTEITVKGWNDRATITKDFKQEELTNYLLYYTVAGYTRPKPETFPQIVLALGGVEIIIRTGFPYIKTMDVGEDAKTVAIQPIIVEKTTKHGKPVKITVNGAITLDTGKYGLTENSGGVWYSLNGIPYFKLQKNRYSKMLGFSDDFVRFVVECDDLRLNMSRTDFFYDEEYDAFEEAVQEAFQQIRKSKQFETFYANTKNDVKVQLQQHMIAKQKDLLSPEKKFVWASNRKLMAEPESEYDTAALLWILEGAGLLPFAQFRTLQYPGYSKGLDMIVELQEDKDSKLEMFAYAELERKFPNLIKHGHEAAQMTFAFCWDIDKSHVQVGTIEQNPKKSYKYSYTISGNHITVFELKTMPGIFCGTDAEAKRFFKEDET